MDISLETPEILDPATQTMPQGVRACHVRRPGRIKLRVLDGPKAGEEFVINRKELRVGRGPAADVRVEHHSLSGLHFELRLGRKGVELLDLASKNGTVLLGRRILHAYVHPGDVIMAGECRIELVETGDVEVEQSREAREDGLLGISEPMREVFATLDKVAPREIAVLVVGKTGTGKDVVARALHRRSRRALGPFEVLDCGALAQTLAESALFGYCKGAFTGADEDRAGVFEQADGGTLLIDEIGELPLPVQAKLLRALESGEIVRVGEVRPRRVDVRVVAATHRDLRRMIDDGTFREDLYYRLARFVIELPTLRERGPEEIEYLARSFLDRIMVREGLSVQLSPAALAKLQRHRWRGNVRELRNALEQATVVCDAGVIEAKHIDLRVYEPGTSRIAEMLAAGSYDQVHDEVDRLLLPRILDECEGNLSEAARRLGVGRKKLTNRLLLVGQP
ncbi:MAG: sigma 54-dependent Fis family transcriptional regulator [Myxococcales bacterium]|nr:sigma 54-dependent Fis family transcriptional regulator [Myxococcales bacterium]